METEMETGVEKVMETKMETKMESDEKGDGGRRRHGTVDRNMGIKTSDTPKNMDTEMAKETKAETGLDEETETVKEMTMTTWTKRRDSEA